MCPLSHTVCSRPPAVCQSRTRTTIARPTAYARLGVPVPRSFSLILSFGAREQWEREEGMRDGQEFCASCVYVCEAGSLCHPLAQTGLTRTRAGAKRERDPSSRPGIGSRKILLVNNFCAGLECVWPLRCLHVGTDWRKQRHLSGTL